MTVHWLVLYCLNSFPDINWWSEVLSQIACLKAKRSRDMSDRVRDRGVAGVGRTAICNLWSILAEVAHMRGKWGWPLYPHPHPHPHPPLPFSTFFLVLAPPSSRGWLGQPWGENMLESRQTIFRLTAFTFSPTRASWKQTDKTKDSKLMTRAPRPNPNPWQLTPDLARPYPSSPPLLPPSPAVLTFDPLQIVHAQSHISGHWHSDTHTHIHTLLPPSPSTLTSWPVASGLDCHRKRETDIQRERVSVSEREKRPLCLCLDLYYHVLILMQFEKETDMETHWVKRDLSVLSGTVCAHSPDMLPTRKSRARLHSLTKALFIHCHLTTRFQHIIYAQGMILHGSCFFATCNVL